jgi:hypothetical protein
VIQEKKTAASFIDILQFIGSPCRINNAVVRCLLDKHTCHDFTDNQVRLQLFALAYNLGNFLRRLALPKKIRDWSLRALQVKLIKIGAKVIRHSRYVIFQMAEVMVSRSLFYDILERIRQLKTIPITPEPG